MSQIQRIRATWGVDGGKNYEYFAKWFPELKALGYSGVEININGDGDFLPDLPLLRRVADDNDLEIVAQVVSHWPHASGARPTGLQPEQHLEYYRKQLEKVKEVRPLKVNAQSGADYWTVEESVQFYKTALAIEADTGLAGKVFHETHRNRSLVTPYVTAQVLREVPGLRITGDFSHHVVCCERLLDLGEEDKQLLNEMIPFVGHIHARIGTTQGSQCPDPSDPVFAEEKRFFDTLWVRIIKDWRLNHPSIPITFTPEYGPYPYHQYNAKRNYGEVADTEGARLQKLFDDALKA